MRRIFLTLAVSLATAASSWAQLPGGLIGLNRGFYTVNPYAGGLNTYSFGYNSSFGFNYVNPMTGGRTVFQYSMGYQSSLPFGPGHPSYFFGTPRAFVNPYLASGVAGYAPAVNPVAVEQARRARLAAANANPKAAVPAPRPADGVPAPKQDFAAKPAPIPPTAPPEEIESGAAINALIADINKLQDGGSKADPPFFPAALLAEVQYTPGPAGDLIRLLQDGAPATPEALNKNTFILLRSELDAAIKPVAEAVLAGKRPDATASEKLAAAVEKARPEVQPVLDDGSQIDAAAVKDYFNGLTALASVAKTPELATASEPNFRSVGANAADYTRHVRKHKLTLAPAAPRAKEAYHALFRGLAGYKAALEPR